MSTLQKKQHYVWKHYLNAWADIKNKLYCYNKNSGRIFKSNTKNLAVETFFYKVYELTQQDLQYLNGMIEINRNEDMRDLNRGFVTMYQSIFELRKIVEASGSHRSRAWALSQLSDAEKTMGERYHGVIEEKALPLIDSLQKCDDSFYEDADRCLDFLDFLCNQFFRTPKIGRATNLEHDIVGLDLNRTRLITSHILATNVGSTLYLERTRYKVCFLINETDAPFITGDQPIINVLDPIGTTDIEFFYPIGPSLAISFGADPIKQVAKSRMLTIEEADLYNSLIFVASENQIYSNDRDHLLRIGEKLGQIGEASSP